MVRSSMLEQRSFIVSKAYNGSFIGTIHYNSPIKRIMVKIVMSIAKTIHDTNDHSVMKSTLKSGLIDGSRWRMLCFFGHNYLEINPKRFACGYVCY